MYFEKNSHYGKQTFWEKRYAEYRHHKLETALSLTGTRIGKTYETSSLSTSTPTVKSLILEQVTID